MSGITNPNCHSYFFNDFADFSSIRIFSNHSSATDRNVLFAAMDAATLSSFA